MGHNTVPVHGGLTVVAAKRLARALTAWRCRAPKLTAVASKWRGVVGVLTDGFNVWSRCEDELATVGNKTRRWRPACTAPGAVNGGIFGTNERS
jgi:hypothetical protein